jgi:hypothetical protein
MRIVGLCLVPVILICLVGAPPVWAQNGCAFFTQGYWKNHPDAWPLDTLTLGTVTYSKDQLLLILRRPVRGNGLVALAHQLIAAKLNVALNEAGFTIPRFGPGFDSKCGFAHWPIGRPARGYRMAPPLRHQRAGRGPGRVQRRRPTLVRKAVSRAAAVETKAAKLTLA